MSSRKIIFRVTASYQKRINRYRRFLLTWKRTKIGVEHYPCVDPKSSPKRSFDMATMIRIWLMAYRAEKNSIRHIKILKKCLKQHKHKKQTQKKKTQLWSTREMRSEARVLFSAKGKLLLARAQLERVKRKEARVLRELTEIVCAWKWKAQPGWLSHKMHTRSVKGSAWFKRDMNQIMRKMKASPRTAKFWDMAVQEEMSFTKVEEALKRVQSMIRF